MPTRERSGANTLFKPYPGTILGPSAPRCSSDTRQSFLKNIFQLTGHLQFLGYKSSLADGSLMLEEWGIYFVWRVLGKGR